MYLYVYIYILISNILIWLVVSTPLKNIRQLGWLFPIYGTIKNVPNHQPVIYPNTKKLPAPFSSVPKTMSCHPQSCWNSPNAAIMELMEPCTWSMDWVRGLYYMFFAGNHVCFPENRYGVSWSVSMNSLWDLMVSENKANSKSSKSDHFSIATHGFWDPP
jgi:hypothetical protein